MDKYKGEYEVQKVTWKDGDCVVNSGWKEAEYPEFFEEEKKMTKTENDAPIIKGILPTAIVAITLTLGALAYSIIAIEPVSAQQYDEAVNAAITARAACVNATMHNEHSGHADVACEQADHFQRQADKLHSIYLEGKVLNPYATTVANYETLQTLESRG